MSAILNNQSVTAIVKCEQLENLQNQMLPFCFAFDKIPAIENDLSRIVSSLIDYPNCAVSFQLIPVAYSAEEATAVDGNAQMLDTLSKGDMDQGVGNISFALAEKHINITLAIKIQHNLLLMFLCMEHQAKQILSP